MTAKLNWLAQVGEDIEKGAKAVLGGATNVINMPGNAIGDIKSMVNAVVTVEAIANTMENGALTGAAKLAAAAPLVQQIVQDSEFLYQKKIQNQAQFAKAIQEITQGMVDLAQSLEAHPAPAPATAS